MGLEKSFLLSSSRSKLIEVLIHMLTNSESLGFELMGFPKGIQMFRSGVMEKKVLTFPGNTAQGKKRSQPGRQVASCAFQQAHRFTESQCSNPGTVGGGGISGKELHRTASHSDIWCREGCFSRGCVKARVALALPETSGEYHRFHKAFPSPLPQSVPRASCFPSALTLGGVCPSPHHTGTEVI